MQKLIIYKDDECSMKRACKALEGKWKIPVIYVLCVNGTLRYSQLRQALGITNVMLSNALKDLEEEGLIERNAYNEIPPRVDYSLSELSRELVPVLLSFSHWGQKLMECDLDSEDECDLL